jgi:DNA-binding transcriptional MerR regulator
MKKLSTIAGIMSLIIFFGVLVSATDIASAQGYRGVHEGKGFWSNLTQEQREAVFQKVKEMREQEATREEIRTAVAQMLEGYGIELPENWRLPRGPKGFGHDLFPFATDLTDEQKEAVYQRIKLLRVKGADREKIREEISQMLEGYGIEVPENWEDASRFSHPWGEFCADLTDEQRETIREKTKKMRDQGATREEIHTAVTEMLEGYGVEVPEDWHGPRGFDHRGGGLMSDLTDEQKEAVWEKIKEMRDQGATREEIRTAIVEMLESYGIDAPEDWPGPRGFGHRRGGLMSDLTDEQKEAVWDKIREMRDQDATREEIRTAIVEMLESYGIDAPEDWPGPRGFGHPWGGFMSNLSDEQREAVREKIKEMRSQGATREEIRAAIDQMIEGFDIDSPQDSESMPSETTPAEIHIAASSYPNPFNPETQIAYTLGTSENVQVHIYNVSGQLIRTYDLGYQPAGNHSIRWDGRNENGDIAASGVYLYRIEAGPHQVTNRMVLLK